MSAFSSAKRPSFAASSPVPVNVASSSASPSEPSVSTGEESVSSAQMSSPGSGSCVRGGRVGGGAVRDHEPRLVREQRVDPARAVDDGDVAVLLRRAGRGVADDEVEEVARRDPRELRRPLGREVGRDVVRVGLDPRAQGVAPRSGRGGAEGEAVGVDRRLGRVGAGVVEAHHDRLAAAVLEEVAHGERERAQPREAAEGTLEVAEAREEHRVVDRPARRAADERRDRRGDAGDRADAARDLFDVYAWVGQLCWHGASLRWAERRRVRRGRPASRTPVTRPSRTRHRRASEAATSATHSPHDPDDLVLAGDHDDDALRPGHVERRGDARGEARRRALVPGRDHEHRRRLPGRGSPPWRGILRARRHRGVIAASTREQALELLASARSRGARAAGGGTARTAGSPRRGSPPPGARG